MPCTMLAHSFEDKGIYYTFNGDGSTVRVTFKGGSPSEQTDEYEGKVTIPSEVTFDGKTYIVTEIGSSAFESCSKITAVTMPETITRIGSSAFSGCSAIKTLTIPKSVAYIGESAFKSCSGMEYISLPDSITLLHNSLFESCRQLASILIPATVREIGSNTFYGCQKLESITLPAAVETIGEQAFGDCSMLEQLTMEGQVEKFCNYVFNGTNLSRVVVPSIEIWMNIQFTAQGSNPLSRGAHLYIGSKEVTDLTVPQGITIIKDNTFYGFKWLKSIKIASSVKEIGNDAFGGCSALASLEISNGVESIGSGAFQGCSELKTVTLPNSVTSIGRMAFNDCSKLASVTLSNRMKSIEEYTFRACGNLKTFTIPNSVKSIGGYAFHGCGSIETLSIPNSVTSIGAWAFATCQSLTTVSMGDSVQTIGEDAFRDCPALTRVESSTIEAWASINFKNSMSNPLYFAHRLYINDEEVEELVVPETVYALNNFAFYGCTSLRSVTLPRTMLNVASYSFEECKNLKSVTLPNTLTAIGYDAFKGCEQLASIVIPNSVKTIEAGAFANCSRLQEVSIGSGVSSIPSVAFQNCERLETVKCHGKVPPSCWSNPFSGASMERCTLFVPTGYLDAYTSVNVWKDFGNIVEEIFEDEDTDLSRFENVIYVEPVSTVSGADAKLSLMLTNSIDIVGFQCDFYVPEGTSVPTDAYGRHLIDLSTERTTPVQTDLFETAVQADGSIRILCGSSSNSVFSGNEGEVAVITLSLPKDMPEGEYPLVIRNVVLSDASGKTITVTCIRTTLTVENNKLGDVNGDKFVNIGDYTAIANHIMGKEQDAFILDAADTNGDETIDVGDLTALVKIIMSGTVPTAVMKHATPPAKASDITGCDNVIYAADTRMEGDGTLVLSVKMKNNISTPGFQFDLVVPEGFEIPVDNEGLYQIELSTERTTTHNTNFFTTGLMADGSVRVLCSSTKSIPFEGNDGEVCTVTIKATDEMALGKYDVVMKNIVISDCDGKTYKPEQTAAAIIVDEQMGIESPGAGEDEESGSIHSLSGQKREHLQKGINIVTSPKKGARKLLVR